MMGSIYHESLKTGHLSPIFEQNGPVRELSDRSAFDKFPHTPRTWEKMILQRLSDTSLADADQIVTQKSFVKHLSLFEISIS
jgi:hypothetical protein